MTVTNYHIPLLILILLLFLPWHAVGTITATYIPESPITLEIAPGPFTHQTVLGAKLGRFIITSPTGVLYSPSFVHIGEASGAIQLTGLMKDYANGPFEMNSNDFYINSVAYPNGLGGTPVLQVLYDDVRPIIRWSANTVTQNPFYVDLYLVNKNSGGISADSGWRPAQYFKLDSPYSLPSNFNPLFSVAVADSPNTNVGTYTSGGTVNETEGSYVVTNGNDGPDNTPIISPGAYTDPNNPGSPGFYYGDVPEFPSITFNFADSVASFSLEAAYPPNKTPVTQATVKVLNGVSGHPYEITLTFTDNSSDASFQLLHKEGIGTPIDYLLFLGNELVTKGVSLPWAGLYTDVSYSKDINIGGINKAIAESKVSGIYEGQISVNISNLH